MFLSVLGISWFWFYGATLLAQFPNYCKDVLGGDEHVATVMLTTFSIGVGAGSLLCERLSGHKVEIGLVPFGSIGLTLFAFDLYLASPTLAPSVVVGAAGFLAQPANWRVLFDLVMIGVFGGLYIVPLYALIQSRSERSHQSRIIAGNNILNAFFMVGRRRWRSSCSTPGSASRNCSSSPRCSTRWSRFTSTRWFRNS